MYLKYSIRVLFLVAASVLLSPRLEAQPDDDFTLTKCARLETGYLFGNQFFKSQTPGDEGFQISYSYGIKAGNHLGLGVGSSFMLFPKETFIPLYVDVMIFARPQKNTTFFNLRSGYALAWSSNYQQYESYSYKGGFHAAFGIGRRFRLNNRFCFALQALYSMQTTSVKYSIGASESIHENMFHHMLSVNLGIMLEQQ